MNNEEAKHIALRLSQAGFQVDVIMAVEGDIETAYSIVAQKIDSNGECWAFLHLRDVQDVITVNALLRD